MTSKCCAYTRSNAIAEIHGVLVIWAFYIGEREVHSVVCSPVHTARPPPSSWNNMHNIELSGKEVNKDSSSICVHLSVTRTALQSFGKCVKSRSIGLPSPRVV